MTPKEKAKELINKFIPYVHNNSEKYETSYLQKRDNAKQCALVCTDEIINSYGDIYDDFIMATSDYGSYSNMRKYWKDVKQELEKL